MQINEQVDAILKGRKFRKMLEHFYEKLRDKYSLKQIELEIIFYLSQRPHDSASDICRNLYLNKGHVSQSMNNLCVKEYLNSYTDSSDRRYVSYDITKKGKVVIEDIISINNSIYEQLLTGISESELKVIDKVVTILSDNMERLTI